ncbi:MAG: shikimate kinase [Bacteroidetes bacterium HGW-Bacteroidetes-8]|jgi:shikimate kinase|nr:MAG: shikimate kinase [Bacteroidetes bacterium HGW-Bacteroidetes-8]
MIISLTGFMGVGKSTIAEKLAAHLYCKHIDLDSYIEETRGEKIVDIFTTLGEESFREIEEQALLKLLSQNSEKVMVLSLGGGALISPKNRELIKTQTQCIYLRASIDTLTQRLMHSRKSRPLVHKEESHSLSNKIDELYLEREGGYRESASIIIDVDNLSLKDILVKILSIV